MPTYLCLARPGLLPPPRRAALARRLTAVHATVTGAPASYVQVVVLDAAPGAHFIGGEPADPRGVHLHGHIRAGRPPEVRQALVTGLRDAVVDEAGVPVDQVWVYVSEIPHTEMVEFGRVLPAPGAEASWLAELPDEVRARLAALDAGSRGGA